MAREDAELHRVDRAPRRQRDGRDDQLVARELMKRLSLTGLQNVRQGLPERLLRLRTPQGSPLADIDYDPDCLLSGVARPPGGVPRSPHGDATAGAVLRVEFNEYLCRAFGDLAGASQLSTPSSLSCRISSAVGNSATRYLSGYIPSCRTIR